MVYFLIICLLHSPATSSLLGPCIFPSILFPNTLNLRSTFSVKDHKYFIYVGRYFVLRVLAAAVPFRVGRPESFSHTYRSGFLPSLCVSVA
jgi:hypothetical protein